MKAPREGQATYQNISSDLVGHLPDEEARAIDNLVNTVKSLCGRINESSENFGKLQRIMTKIMSVFAHFSTETMNDFLNTGAQYVDFFKNYYADEMYSDGYKPVVTTYFYIKGFLESVVKIQGPNKALDQVVSTLLNQIAAIIVEEYDRESLYDYNRFSTTAEYYLYGLEKEIPGVLTLGLSQNEIRVAADLGRKRREEIYTQDLTKIPSIEAETSEVIAHTLVNRKVMKPNGNDEMVSGNLLNFYYQASLVRQRNLEDKKARFIQHKQKYPNPDTFLTKFLSTPLAEEN